MADFSSIQSSGKANRKLKEKAHLQGAGRSGSDNSEIPGLQATSRPRVATGHTPGARDGYPEKMTALPAGIPQLHRINWAHNVWEDLLLWLILTGEHFPLIFRGSGREGLTMM